MLKLSSQRANCAFELFYRTRAEVELSKNVGNGPCPPAINSGILVTLVDPVFNSEVGNWFEVASVCGDQEGTVLDSNRRDLEVHCSGPDLLSSVTVEQLSRRFIKR